MTREDEMDEYPTTKVDHGALLETIEGLSGRGLIQASRWLAEIARDIEFSCDAENNESISAAAVTLEYRIAKSFFDCGEYKRCAEALMGRTTSDTRSQFLQLYSSYLAAERNREEASETVLGPNDGSTQNKELTIILGHLQEIDNADSYLLYLEGFICRQLERPEHAVVALSKALMSNSYNWAAWEELSACMSSAAMINQVLSELPDTLLSRIFRVVALLDLHASGDDIGDMLSALEKDLGENVFVKSLRAILAYNAQDFETAETIFDEILQHDPYRLDNLDIYSNVLFVLDRRAKLSHLAKVVSEVDKFRPETCVVIGNYYSLLSDHEKAVTYFRKALKLNRSYLAAWTLMGHEYVELKNTHAAIESYRRAVDINKKDYRAWYGLGQAYEMLEMHYYALHYFQRAAALKPYDLRMWTAMGNCYEKLGRFSESIKSYQRALLGDGSLDASHLMKIGELYERAGDLTAARKHFQAAVDACSQDGSLDSAPAQAWLDRHDR